MKTHVTLASGGTYVVMYAAFVRALDRMPAGKKFRQEITDVSGSSAGALVASALAFKCPGNHVYNCATMSGVRSRFTALRALAVFLKLRPSLFSSKRFVTRMRNLLSFSSDSHLPLTIAVTDTNLKQKCKNMCNSSASDVARIAMASAAIPFVWQPENVDPFGLCCDGSVAQHVFANEKIQHILKHGSGRLVVVNCVPWPGFRPPSQPLKNQTVWSIKRLLTEYDRQLYNHGMEKTFDFVIQPRLSYQNGIFDIHVNNKDGSPTISSTGNLHVIFVAPTTEQFQRCGGQKSKTKLGFKPHDKMVSDMTTVGQELAAEFITRYQGLCCL